jgi:hypothetical protein
LAEDCLLAQPVVGLLWRKPTLKSHFSAAENDPQKTFGSFNISFYIQAGLERAAVFLSGCSGGLLEKEF